MKKTTLLVCMMFVFGMVFAHADMMREDTDLQAIKKAVKDNPAYKPGQEVKWFKVLIQDVHSKKTEVKVTLPISLIELFIKHSHDKHLRIHEDEYDVDLKELFRDLKEAGPMALIEVTHHHKLIRLWLE